MMELFTSFWITHLLTLLAFLIHNLIIMMFTRVDIVNYAFEMVYAYATLDTKMLRGLQKHQFPLIVYCDIRDFEEYVPHQYK